MHSKVNKLLVLQKESGLPVKYFPNTGNAGDSLINVGFYQLAESIGLKYEIIDASYVKRASKDDVVIIGGGGALVPEWDSTPKFIDSVIGACGKIIILPQSIRGVDELLVKLGKNDVVFCREKYSYLGCQALNLTCSLQISNDMAFNVDVEKLKSSKKARPEFDFKNALRVGAYFYHYAIRSNISRSINAFRCDKESNLEIKVKRRKLNDFSAIARFGNRSVANANLSAYMFIKLIDMYEKVTTDRLHVVVGASLLNKEIIAYPNSYYKVKGVVEYSLHDYSKINLQGQ